MAENKSGDSKSTLSPEGMDFKQAFKDGFTEALEESSKPKRNFHATIKHVGRRQGLKITNFNKKDVQVYMSYPKSYMLYHATGPKETQLIIFQNNRYETDDKVQKEFLNGHPGLGKDFWKDKWPDYVVKKFKQESELLTRNEDVFVPAEA